MPNKYMLTIPWHANIFVYWLTTYRLSELNFLFILKVANIRCFILINCSCIFHNIIVNTRSLERRKYIAVWFSSIQERIQCWPTQYSYDLTVNSFGKLFADEENVGLFLLISSLFLILSVILTKYHYIILTDYPGIQFHRYIS